MLSSALVQRARILQVKTVKEAGWAPSTWPASGSQVETRPADSGRGRAGAEQAHTPRVGGQPRVLGLPWSLRMRAGPQQECPPGPLSHPGLQLRQGLCASLSHQLCSVTPPPTLSAQPGGRAGTSRRRPGSSWLMFHRCPRTQRISQRGNNPHGFALRDQALHPVL